MPLAEAGEADDAPRGGLPSLPPPLLPLPSIPSPILVPIPCLFLSPPPQVDPAQSPAGSPPRCLRFLILPFVSFLPS